MSIPFSGTRGRAGLAGAVAKQIKLINLKAAKRVTVKFDPFGERVTNTRLFAHVISSPKIGLTNPNCFIKTEVVCDRSEPEVVFKILPEIAETAGYKTLTLKCGNLTCLELLQLVNEHVTKIAPKEEPVNAIQTKSEKKISKKR